jgi:predicted DNA-binding transcriptional regulator YafY
MNYAVEQRLRLIDFLLHNYGSVSRCELIDFFGISEATATRDFALYADMAPGNALLNQSKKRWVKSSTFKRVYA